MKRIFVIFSLLILCHATKVQAIDITDYDISNAYTSNFYHYKGTYTKAEQTEAKKYIKQLKSKKKGTIKITKKNEVKLDRIFECIQASYTPYTQLPCSMWTTKDVATLSISVKQARKAHSKSVWINNQLNQLVIKLNLKNRSEEERIQAISYYLCSEYTYDKTLKSDTLYEAFTTQKLICTTYADIFQQLCLRSGTICDSISSDTINHVWNRVYTDGMWKQIDVCWIDNAYDNYDYTVSKNDSQTFVQWQDTITQSPYYLVTDTEMAKTHGFDWEIESVCKILNESNPKDL